jgi:GT2 family glycosyltransferase
VVYGNSLKVGASRGERDVLRPALSPERLRCQFYWGNFVLIRRELFSALGGLNPSLPGAELYDVMLRAVRDGASVSRIEAALTATRGNQRTREGLSPVEWAIAKTSLTTVLEQHLAATGGGTVISVGEDGVHHTIRDVIGDPLVSIVIPTRGVFATIDGRDQCFLLDAIASIQEKSTYANIEFVIVVDDVADPAVLTDLRRLAGEKLRLVVWDKPFNFSDKVNFGAVHASGEYLLILNDDVTVITPDWIERLLALAQLPGAGMAGAMLYFGDDTIQHAGHAYYRGEASHVGLDMPRGSAGPLDGYRVEREIAGVTAACALMPTAVFFEAGGFTGLLPGNFNDVDLCMKVTWLGYDIYWTPHAELYHFESKTRDATVMGFEVEVNWGRWANRMHDAAYWPYPLTRKPVSWISGIW